MGKLAVVAKISSLKSKIEKLEALKAKAKGIGHYASIQAEIDTAKRQLDDAERYYATL
jgi:predicted  nucleic acid-binding Zn-ribbon protein